MNVGRLVSSLGFAVLLATACGGDDNGDSSPSYQTACGNACDAAHHCNSNVNVATCTTDCQNSYADNGPNLSAAYVTAVDQCIQDATCAQLAGAVFFNTCYTRAVIEITPTPTVERFCAAVGEADVQCSRFPREIACLAGLKIYSDNAISRAQACLDQSCNLQETCVEDTLGQTF